MQHEASSYNSGGYSSAKVTNQSSENPNSTVITNNNGPMISLTSTLKILLIISGILYIITGILVIILQVWAVFLSTTTTMTSTALNILQMIYLIFDGVQMISAARKSSYEIKSLKRRFIYSLIIGIIGTISMGVVVGIVQSICGDCADLDLDYLVNLLDATLGIFVFLTVYSISCVIYVYAKQKDWLAYNNTV